MSDDFKVDFIGIGAPKCATTWLFRKVKEHPEVCGSSKKEINFFNQRDRYRKGLKFYRSFFEHCGDKIKGEFTIFYLQNEEAPKRIAETFPKVKLIVSLRNPKERAYSHYRFAKNIQGRTGIYSSFRETLRKDKDLREMGLYGKHLERWLDYFSREQFLILKFEDIKNHPKKTLKKVYTFLEVDPSYLPDKLKDKVNPTGERKVSLKVPWINRFAYSWWSYFKRNKLARNFLTSTGLRSVGRMVVQKNKRVEKGSTPKITNLSEVNDQAKALLDKIYNDDISKLEEILGQDFPEWKK